MEKTVILVMVIIILLLVCSRHRWKRLAKERSIDFLEADKKTEAPHRCFACREKGERGLCSQSLDTACGAPSVCRKNETVLRYQDIPHWPCEGFTRRELERGFANAEFQMYLHFYVAADTERLAGGEALCRWEHPERGVLAPAEFLPALIREGMLEQLDHLMLESACALLAELHRKQIDDFFVLCNFSDATVQREEFIDRCEFILKRHEFRRERLVFELGREAVLQCSGPGGQRLWNLRESGIRFALGRISQNFMALLGLRRVMVDVLVFDPCMMEALGTDTGNVFLRSIIQAGHELGCRVFATGVERSEQASALQVIGCDLMQGYCFGKPLPAREAAKLLYTQMESKNKTILAVN